MRNITGAPAENDDFFDRDDDIRRFRRELANDANILLIAPRRVGKTSFVLRLCREYETAGSAATFFNVEGCNDEIDFAQALIDGLRDTGVEPAWLPTIADSFRRIRQALGKVKVGVGVDVEISDVPDLAGTTLSRLLESILERIEAAGRTVLVAVDELPELLLGIARQEYGLERVTRLLHWLRSVRQTHRRRVRWLFLGSIGLDSFVDDRNLRKTINDLTLMTLGAFSPGEADHFLDRLGRDNRLPLDPAVRAHILERVGWPLPYHLQILFHTFVDLGIESVRPEHVENAIEHLLRPDNFGYFDTWRQRLDDQLSIPDAAAAKAILKMLCQHPTGRTRHELFDALMIGQPAAHPGRVEDQLAKLLIVLIRDGYLQEQGGRYQFRSFLLREYWFRREVR